MENKKTEPQRMDPGNRRNCSQRGRRLTQRQEIRGETPLPQKIIRLKVLSLSGILFFFLSGNPDHAARTQLMTNAIESSKTDIIFKIHVKEF